MKRVYVRIIKEYKITFLLAYLLIETMYKMFSHGEKIPSDKDSFLI